jgi:hypothetical protein
MNDESLERVNAFLAAIAVRVPLGELLEQTPAELGREIGLDPLTTARAVRALIGRKRIAHIQDTYRLLDRNQIAPDEPGEFRARRKPGSRPPARAKAVAQDSGPSYAGMGRDAVSILMELSEEAKRLTTAFETASEEARTAREQMEESEQRARAAGEKVRGLETRAEMAEANLRSVQAAFKSGKVKIPEESDDPLLAFLRGESGA